MRNDDDSSDSENNKDDETEFLNSLVKKTKKKSKKRGRCSSWSPEEVDDLVDITVNNLLPERTHIYKYQKSTE